MCGGWCLTQARRLLAYCQPRRGMCGMGDAVRCSDGLLCGTGPLGEEHAEMCC